MRIVHEGLSPVEFTQHEGKRVFVRTTDGTTETGILRLASRAIEVHPKPHSVFLSVPYTMIEKLEAVDDVAK